MSPSAAPRRPPPNNSIPIDESVFPAPAPDVAPTAPESEAETRQKQSQLARDTAAPAGTAVERYRAISAEIADDPDRMLTEIRDLLDQGKTVQARELLTRLRADHSDYTVPEEIEEAVAQPD